MKTARFTLILLGLILGTARAQEPVHFSDAVLKAEVEDELWITDPTPSDMLGLTSLTCTGGDDESITSLTGLEYAANLQTLVLNNHRIGSISALSGLTNLKTLRLERNQISSIRALSGLVNLRTLNLKANSVSSIGVLSELTGLTSINLHRNEVSNISALSELTSLTFLDLRINPLNSAAYNTYIPRIKENNPGISLLCDPDVVYRLVFSSTAGGAVTEPGEGEFTFRYYEPVFIKAEAEPGFMFSRWLGWDSGSADSIYMVVTQSNEMRACFVCLSDTIYVDDDAAGDPQPGDASAGDPQEDGTIEHPFDSIQEAIEVAADGASIIVHSGTYQENLDFLGKRIDVLGTDVGADTVPVIDGSGAGPVVRFASGEDSNCTLAGFCLTGGRGDLAGAVDCNGSSPTIAHCLIVGNRATDPNGAAVCCVDSEAVLINCTVADNEGSGVAMTDSSITLLNAIVWGNDPEQIRRVGGGTSLVTYCDVAGGWPGLGNIDADPLFARRGRWMLANDSGGATDPDALEASWTDGDYHLRSAVGHWNPETQSWQRDPTSSPCIDGGDPDAPVGEEPAPNGARVNMGAYGDTAEASKSP